jgi:transposase
MVRHMTTTKKGVTMRPVEVITSVERRRRWTAEEKLAMVQEAEQPGMSISAVARRHGIHPNQLFGWRRLMQEGALVAAGSNEPVVPLSEVKELRYKIRELERLLGRKTMEVEILKEGLQIAREKKLISRMPSLPGRDTQ